MRVLEIASAHSTNSWVAGHAAQLEAPVLVYAVEQTAGRGQRGNSWESAPGKNLTASALFVPSGVAPSHQFVISEAVALAAAELVTSLLGDAAAPAEVKWPNDIYVGGKKICGILIEHSIFGREIRRTIAGVGININQETFESDAPNPVSVKQISGGSHDIRDVAGAFAEALGKRLGSLEAPEKLHSEFMGRLWRGDGRYYPFCDKKREEMISAKIAGISEEGVLTLQLEDGSRREYAFKEVEFII